MIVNVSDFQTKSFYQVSSNRFTTDDLLWYIEDVEKQYLVMLLGCDLYELFEADLVDGVPVEQRFLEIFNPICEDDPHTGKQIVSLGIKDMLMGFIYFHFVRSQSTNNTITGNVEATNEISRAQYLTELSGSLSVRFNRAVKSANAIRDYITKNQEHYSEYNGKKFESLGIAGAY